MTWLGSIDLQCTVLVLSLFHERFLDSHLSYKMSSTATLEVITSGLFFIWRSHGFTTSSQLFTVAVASW